jgi:nucleotide-binding universal stress UspA family protein
MATRVGDFRVLVATDGSTHARAAIATLSDVPWPERTRVRAVVAKKSRAPYQRSILLSALDRSAEDAAARARQTLAREWPDAEAVVVNQPPVAGILAEAERFRADVIVVGWRGHGTARRLLMGSVSRGVVRGAKRAVLVVRRPPGRIRTVAIAFDGSPHALRAVALIAKLAPPRDGRVRLIGVVELMTPSSAGPAVAGIRSTVAQEVRRINAARSRAARTALTRAAAELKRAGWQTRTELKTGEPLAELLARVSAMKPQLLAVGARGTSGVRHLLLGSVAQGVLNRCPVPVLLAR